MAVSCCDGRTPAQPNPPALRHDNGIGTVAERAATRSPRTRDKASQAALNRDGELYSLKGHRSVHDRASDLFFRHFPDWRAKCLRVVVFGALWGGRKMTAWQGGSADRRLSERASRVRVLKNFRRLGRSALITLAIVALPTQAAIISSVDRAAFQSAVAGGMISQARPSTRFRRERFRGVTPDITFGASRGSPIVRNRFLTTTPPNGLGETDLDFFLPRAIPPALPSARRSPRLPSTSILSPHGWRIHCDAEHWRYGHEHFRTCSPVSRRGSSSGLFPIRHSTASP